MTKKDIKEMLIKDGTVKKNKIATIDIYDLVYDGKEIWGCHINLINEKQDQEKIRKEVIKLYLKKGLSKYSFSPFYRRATISKIGTKEEIDNIIKDIKDGSNYPHYN